MSADLDWRNLPKINANQEKDENFPDWKSLPEIDSSEKNETTPFIERIAANVPAEFFGGAIGSIPSLATAQAELQPQIELTEKLATPEFLTSTGLEPAPEKGLSNLLAFLGKNPELQKYTIPELREKFKETTGGKFEPQTSVEKILAHGASSLGAALPLGGLPAATSVGFGGIVGQTARELGLPENISSTLEFIASLSPGLGKAQVLPKSEQKQLVDFARKQGLTETEITPLLKGEFSQDILSKLAFKGPRTKKVVQGIEQKLGGSFDIVSQEASKMPRLTEPQVSNLINKFDNILYRLEKNVKPAPDEEKAIEFIRGAKDRLEKVGADPEELENFWRSINRGTNWNNIPQGKKLKFQLKQPIQETFEEINPQFARDFELNNELYSKFKEIENQLKPDMVDKFKILGTAGTIFTGIVTLNPSLLSTGMGALASQILARELLINPRFQALHRKAMEGFNKGNLKFANSTLQVIEKDIKKKYPEEFKNIDFGSLLEPPTNSTKK